MRKPLISLVFLLVLLAEGSGQVGVSLQPETRTISPQLIGINGRSTEGPSWDDAVFLTLVDAMRPGMVRYPAGTQANYWDWRTGTFIEGCGKTAKYNFSMASFVAGLPVESEIIYVVNMARPTPASGVDLNASEAVLKSDETLLLKIEDILAALSEFKRLRRFPEAIELGNEFYFDNEHAAIYAADPAFYMNHAQKVCHKVKEVYPDLKILLCTTKGGTTSRENWNNTVFNTLQRDAEFAGLVHGIVQHHYINAAYGDPALVVDVASAKKAMAEGFQYPQEHASDYAMVPADLALWLTEYGATKENADGSWTAGLRAVSMTLGWMDLGNNIERLFYHHITDNPNVINKDHMELGPIGMALGLLGEAAQSKIRLQEIQFTNNPLASGSIVALHGYKFKNQEEETLFILNIGDESHEAIDISGLLSYSGLPQLTQHWSVSPYESPVFEGSGIETQEKALNGHLTIHPFSVAMIKVANDGNTGIEEQEWMKQVKIYPSAFDQRFTLELPIDTNESEVVLSDLSGQVCYQSKVKSATSHHTPHVSAGLYVLTIKTKQGIISQKVRKK